MWLSGCFALLLVICFTVTCLAKEKPNIIIILADDLGWNDVGFHGSNQIPTPNIDSLAYNGIMLNSHYTPALCTPSRASLLTGKYPTSIGMQHMVILAPEPWGLPLTETLMPEHLKRHGYKTHAVGKWHLGFFKREYTPTYRGFDSFYGYWNGYQDYYEHTMKETSEPFQGYDMRRNLDVDWSAQGKYSTDLFTDEAVAVIQQHNTTEGPLFMYLAHLAPHSGNEDHPYQAPDEDIARMSHIADAERRVYGAMVSRVDRSVGEVMSALREKNMLENSLVLFLSDNGAVTFGMHSNHGSNFPLRGLKESPWEGGIRSIGALWSPLLNKTQIISNHMMHMADWLPTLYSAAGLNSTELGDIDGIDLWESLKFDRESPRSEILHNIDEVEGYSALVVGEWKLIEGTAQGGEVDSWYGETGRKSVDGVYDIQAVLRSKASAAISGYLTEKQLENYGRGNDIPNLVTPQTIHRLREETEIHCVIPHVPEEDTVLDEHFVQSVLNRFTKEINSSYSSLDAYSCDPRSEICLFNIKHDPCEQINLAKVYPEIVEALNRRLKEHMRFVVPPLNQPADPFADPVYHNNVWSPWMDDPLPRSTSILHLVLNTFDVASNEIRSISVVIVNFVFSVCVTLCSIVLLILFAVLVLLVSSSVKNLLFRDFYHNKPNNLSYFKNNCITDENKNK